MRLKLGIAVLSCALAASTSATAQIYDYCKTRGAKVTVVFIDRTTAFDKKDEEILLEGFEGLVGKLGPGDRLVIRTITDDHSRSDQLFNRCKPGCPKDMTFRDEVLGTCSDLVARRDNLDFMRRLAGTLREVLREKREYRASAIIETLAFALGSFEGRIAQVVLYSDMIENSRLAKFGILTERGIAPLMARLKHLSLIPNLNGVKLTAFGFGRTDASNRQGLNPQQQGAIRGFWRSYCAEAKAAQCILSERLFLE